MKKQFIFFIFILFFCIKSFGQNESLYYKKGIEIVLDSLIKESPKAKFFLGDDFTRLNTSEDPFYFFDCSINFKDFKQARSGIYKIIIPSSYSYLHKSNNFFNKLIYGKKLTRLYVDVLFEDSKNIIFIANFYFKENGFLMLVKFKNNSLDIEEFCKTNLIH
jgi:hypothetical protein